MQIAKQRRCFFGAFVAPFFSKENLQVKKALISNIQNDNKTISPLRKTLKSLIEDEELAVIEMGMDGLRTNSKIINNDKAIYRCNYKHRFFTYRKTSEVLKIYYQQRWK